MADDANYKGLAEPVKIDFEGFLHNIMRKGTPRRVYHAELFIDEEVQAAVAERFGLAQGLDQNGPHFAKRLYIAVQRFLGYDFVRATPEGLMLEYTFSVTGDTAETAREAGRSWMEEHRGPITTWEDFEKYPWPDLSKTATESLEWFSENLPDDMCIFSGGLAFCEHLCWLMGYESLCYALYENRDLVRAIYEKIFALEVAKLRTMLQFDRVKVVWGSDDMGFKTATMISPDDLREFVFPGHRKLAEMAHEAGRPYFLHSCGNRSEIYDDLLNDVKIDAIHSFEDTIELVTDTKREYGDRLSLIGGIDVDFLCRATPEQIRSRVRDTLDVCNSGGGYALGSGNSVANYVPLDNFLAMVDEGRRYL